ncbi:MAG: hypothetical protein WC989_08070 [Micavibrio sp.]
MSDIENAVINLFEKNGVGYCFPSDEIWIHYNGTELTSSEKPGLIRKLVKNEYIVATNRITRAVSGARKGSPTKEYTFGKTVSPESLQAATANSAKEIIDGTRNYDENSSHPLNALENPHGKFPLDQPLQRLIHGCPGSGKSHLLEADAANAHFVIRTVFHPETSYSDFVGSLRPQSIYKMGDEDLKFSGSTIDVPGEPYVQYVVQTGALLKAYNLACAYPNKSVVLIVEELSRAVAAHVFGDTLQLLDRIEDTTSREFGYSTYEIEPRPDISNWLTSNEIWHDQVSLGGMRFPPNLYIWATMNRADQNARQLDSAFLRRWDKHYLSYLVEGKNDSFKILYGGAPVSWKRIREHINNKLKSLEGIPEDKFVGPYMISARKLDDPRAIYEDLWGYIWNDVLKARSPLFFEGIKTFADLEAAWDMGKGSPIGTIVE